MAIRPFVELPNRGRPRVGMENSPVGLERPMQNTRAIRVIAEDYVKCAEVTAAFDSILAMTCVKLEANDTQVQHWAALSQWERQRKLRELEEELAHALESLEAVFEEAERLVALNLQRCEDVDAYFRQVIESHASPPPGEIAYRLSQTRAVRDSAVQQLKCAAEERNRYTEGRGLVALAQARALGVRRHCSEMRRVRIRAASAGFLLGLVTIIAVAELLHYHLAR